MAHLPRAPFRVGMKEVYLPDFTITLLRTQRMPPTHAKFQVPLKMNKLDLRDYLYHCYGIRTVSVRSYIEQQPVRQGKPSDNRPRKNVWFRPQAIKKMTVEMEHPFVWPEVPEDLGQWSHDTFEKSRLSNEEYSKKFSSDADTMFSQTDRDVMREQAKELLEGKTKWRPGLAGKKV